MDPINEERIKQTNRIADEARPRDIVVDSINEAADTAETTRKKKYRKAKSFFDKSTPKSTSKKSSRKKIKKAQSKEKESKIERKIWRSEEEVQRPQKVFIEPEAMPQKAEDILIEAENEIQSQEQFVAQEPIDIVDDYELPDTYDLTYVTLITRDPFWMYAYWEIGSEAVEQVKQTMGDEFYHAAYTLRVYDVTLVDFNGLNANSFTDYDELFAMERYINIPNDDATFVAEIGLRTHDGRFFAFARSNFVTAQRANQSNDTALIWKEVEDLDHQETFANVDIHKEKIKSLGLVKNNWQSNLRKVPLSFEDIYSFYKNTATSSGEYRRRMEKEIRDQLGLKEGEKIVFEESSSSILAADQPSYKEYYRRGSEQFVKEFPGASERLVLRKDERIAVKKKSFPFEVEMELTVRGKTLPDAKVYLGDKPIELNGDGTFTLKYQLNDGVLPFDFVAKTKEEDMEKKINTSVIRTQTQEDRDDFKGYDNG